MSPPLLPNETRGPSLIICQWITVSIASLLVFLRIYTRKYLRKTPGADDGTMVTALSFAAAQTILTIFSGRQWVWKAHRVLHTIGTLLVRVSVCLFLLRLVPPTHREFHKYTYNLIAFFAVISTATFLLILLACIPIQGTWDMRIKARCIARSDLSTTAKTQGGVSALMDFLCVRLPIFFLRNLQARLGRKISVFVLLGLGLFTAACAILRSATISFADEDYTCTHALRLIPAKNQRIPKQVLVGLVVDAYALGHSVPVAFWACLEQSMGIIVASTPAVHQLYTVFPDSGRSYPRVRSLKLRTASGYTSTSDGSHNDKMWLGSRGSQSMGMMSNAYTVISGGGGDGVAILPGPPSPTKKEPRTDYDSPTLDISPKLEQAATRDEGFSYRG